MKNNLFSAKSWIVVILIVAAVIALAFVLNRFCVKPYI